MTFDSIQSDDRERGSAMIEFIALGTMLFVPTIYFLLTIFAIQSAGFAASAASQQGIIAVRNMGENRQMSLDNVHTIASIAVQDYGIDSSQLAVEARCATSACDQVTVRTTVTVDLPLIPWIAPGGVGTMSSEATWWGGKYR